ncbi:hypothetical protein [Sphaerimonospora mesophila]|uniref:hypothetical protein n=1 Tax=Sphaerimonospora mesophila TaxID=37483 RepID=UPI00128F7222
MPGMPNRARLHIIAVVTLTLVAASGCTSNETPTAAQAGQTLKKHILQLLKERNAQNITITDPGGKNIPCADGRVKQTFGATGSDLPDRRPDALVDALLGALKRVAPYRITSFADHPGDPITVQSESSQTILTLSAPTNGKYVVSGETKCLSTD